MIKTIRCLAVTCLMLLSAGCGMLAVPSRVTLPAKPMRTILVSDRDTGAVVASADVTFQMWKYVNWMEPMPLGMWGPYSQTSSNASQPELADSWSATALGDGLFQFEPKSRTKWTQV